MPTYDYECMSCGIHFEQFQSIKDKPLGKCPTCNGEVKRLISSGAGFIFKGSGFYQTDYKSPKINSSKKADNTKNLPACGKTDSCQGCKQNV